MDNLVEAQLGSSGLGRAPSCPCDEWRPGGWLADVGWDNWAHVALVHVVSDAPAGQLGCVHMVESGAMEVSGSVQGSCGPDSNQQSITSATFYWSKPDTKLNRR